MFGLWPLSGSSWFDIVFYVMCVSKLSRNFCRTSQAKICWSNNKVGWCTAGVFTFSICFPSSLHHCSGFVLEIPALDENMSSAYEIHIIHRFQRFWFVTSSKTVIIWGLLLHFRCLCYLVETLPMVLFEQLLKVRDTVHFTDNTAVLLLRSIAGFLLLMEYLLIIVLVLLLK